MAAVVGIAGGASALVGGLYKSYPGRVEAVAQSGGSFNDGEDSFYTPGLFLRIFNRGTNRVREVVVRVGEPGALLVNRNIGSLDAGGDGVVPTVIGGEYTDLRVEVRWKRTVFRRRQVTFLHTPPR